MTNKVFRMFGENIERRSFLKRAALAVGAVVAGVFGVERAAYATVKVWCCQLCHHPDTCTWGGCTAGTWFWTCPYNPDCIVYACYECFSSGTPGFYCAPNVICSKVEKFGVIPPPCVKK
jgi:hypothetical protein